MAMGSCFGPTFASFYMCNLENRVLENGKLRPETYCRYVDDIYVVIRDQEHFLQLKEALEQSSVLQFTYEISKDNHMAFLDVHVNNKNCTYITKVLAPLTNICLATRFYLPGVY